MTGITIVPANITVQGFNAAQAGTLEANDGENGSFSFTVEVSKGTESDIAERSGSIIATKYDVETLHYGIVIDTDKQLVGSIYHVKIAEDIANDTTYECITSVNVVATFNGGPDVMHVDDTLINQLVSYRINSDWTIGLYSLPMKSVADFSGYTNGASTLSGTYTVSDSTVAFVLDNFGEYHMYKGKNNIPSISQADSVYVVTESTGTGVLAVFFKGAIQAVYAGYVPSVPVCFDESKVERIESLGNDSCSLYADGGPQEKKVGSIHSNLMRMEVCRCNYSNNH